MARLIDADEMIKGICFIIEDSKKLLTSSVVRKAMLGLVDRIKTVDAAPVRHGRWKPDTAFGNDIMSGRMVLCSRCGKGVMTGPVPYCPWCGAKMDGGDLR